MFQKNSPLESTYGLHHRWRPSLRGRRRSVVAAEVTCRSLNKLDDSTLLKRKSKLRGKSARRGEGMKHGGHQAGCRASMDHHDRSACRFYICCSSERPRRANLADVVIQLFIVQYGRKTARIDVISPSHPEAPRSMSNYDLTRNNLDNLIGVTDKLRSLVTELKSELQTELIRLRL